MAVTNGRTIEATNSLFEQPWWLDAVAPGAWGEALVKRGEEIAARLPYATKSRYGLKIVGNPPLTQTLGPWLRASTAKYSHQLTEQKELFQELIAQLPRCDFLRLNLSPRITNWLPFYWEGFSAMPRYTYVLDELTNQDGIWAGFSDATRRAIRKAQKQVTVRTDLDVERFLDLNRMTFERQGVLRRYPDELVIRLDDACRAQNARRIFFAEDGSGKIHAALYLVWDANAAYYLMGGGDPALRASGAGSLLMWEAIRFAATVTKRFDFEGSMIEPIERFFRGFGARQSVYFHVTRMSRRMKIAMAGRDLLQAIGRQ